MSRRTTITTTVEIPLMAGGRGIGERVAVIGHYPDLEVELHLRNDGWGHGWELEEVAVETYDDSMLPQQPTVISETSPDDWVSRAIWDQSLRAVREDASILDEIQAAA